jgi:hypothetical protein
MELTRRQLLKGALAAGAGAALAVPAARAAERGLPRAERVTFDLPGLDPAHDGVRVAQLSDLHVGPRTDPETVQAALAAANAFEPDLVVLTGDYLSHSRREVAEMRDQLGGLRAPTYAVLGNHDVWVDPAGATLALRAHGYEVLENAWTTLTLRGAPFPIVGVGDHLTGRDDVARALRGLPGGAAPLVLAHGPRTAERVAAAGRPALCLAGHTHGGQLMVPILTRLVLSGLAKEPYLRGRHVLGPVQLYVNRGVGMSGVRIRVNAPPEVTLATLRAAPPRAPRSA